MLAVWHASAFAAVESYETWERNVNERLAEVIERGELVPVAIRGDGAFVVRLAVAPDGPSERETRHTMVTSEPYLLVSDGGMVCVSGVEAVGDARLSPLKIRLPKGRYSVRISLIAWDEEPGSRGTDGRPTSDALPDFLVHLTPSERAGVFRTSEVTFHPLS